MGKQPRKPIQFSLIMDPDTTVTATVGQSVSLPCRTVSPTTVDWWYQVPPKEDVSFVCLSGRVINGYTERFRVETEGNNKIHDLVIKHVQADDTGLYTCIEDAGQGKHHYVYLNVTGAFGAMLAIVNQTVTLPCRTELDVAVDWLYEHPTDETYSIVAYNGVVVNGRFTIDSIVKGDYTLDIRDVRVSDAGRYTCVEDAGQGKRHSFILSVMEPGVSVTDEVGQTARLPCRTILPLSVDWWHQVPPKDDVYFVGLADQAVNGYNTSGFAIETDHKYKHDLIIKDVLMDYTGLYTCIEDDGQGTKHFVYLSVRDIGTTRKLTTAPSSAPTGKYTVSRSVQRNNYSISAVFVEIFLWIVIPAVIIALPVTGIWLYRKKPSKTKIKKKKVPTATLR